MATQPQRARLCSVEGRYEIQELRVSATQMGGLGDLGAIRRAVHPSRPAQRRRQAANLRRADRPFHLPQARPAEAVPMQPQRPADQQPPSSRPSPRSSSRSCTPSASTATRERTASPSCHNRPSWLLQEAYELGRWMHLSYANGKKDDCPAFTAPSSGRGTETEKKLKREKVSILQRLAAQEAEMQKLLGRPGGRPLQGEGRRRDGAPTASRPSSRPASRRRPRLRRSNNPPPPDRQPARFCRLERRGQG